MKLSRFAVSGAVCAALLGFGAVTATQATAAESSAVAPRVAVQQEPYWEEYYPNWFYGKPSCDARGESISNPSSPQYIPGTIDFECYVREGESKWTMAILRCDCQLASGDTNGMPAQRPMSILRA